MESNREPTPRHSREEARASLQAVDRVQADLADRLVTPWWYHPGLGLVEALFVSSMTFPIWWQIPAVAIGAMGLGILIGAYKKLTGLGMSPQYSVLAREWVIALILVLAVAIAVVLLVDEPAVTAITAAVVLVATVILGRRADSTLRDRLRHGTRTR